MILLRSFLSGHIRIKRTLEYYDAGIGPRVPFGGGGGAVSPIVSSIFASELGDYTTLSTTSSMPTGGLITRAGNATLYDSTGKLTWAPNNQYINSGSATNTARTITTVAGVNYYIWIQTSTGTATIVASGTNTTTFNGSTSGTFTAFTATAGTLTLTPTSNYANITQVVVAQITYETALRSGDNYVTGAAAYYGPRFDYNPATLAAKGLLVEGTRTNALSYSQDISNAAWIKNSSSVSGTTTGPDGVSNSAQKLIEAANTAEHKIYRSVITTAANTTYCWSFYAKAAERTWVYIDAAIVVDNYIWFDLSNGVVGTIGAADAYGSAATASIVPVGNGWYRISAVRTTTSTTGILYSQIGVTTGDGVTSYTGNGTSGAYVWGAQFETGSFPTSYIPTTTASVARAAESFTLASYTNRLVESFYIDEQTAVSSSANIAASATSPVTISTPTFGWVTSLRAYVNAAAGTISTPTWIDNSGTTGNRMMYDSTGTLTWAPANLVTYSQDFTNAAWLKASATVPVTLYTAPDGTSTANLLYPTSTGTYRDTYRNISANSGIYTLSVYAKAAGINFLHILDYGASLGAVPAYFNLSTGAVGTVASGWTASIADAGNGWYRCSVTNTSAVAVTAIQFGPNDANGSLTTTASGTNGIYIWGAQLEPVTYQTSPRTYIPTTSAAVYQPRYDYDPSVTPATPRGMLIEEGRTNIALSAFTSTNWTTGQSTKDSTIAGPDAVSGSAQTIKAVAGNNYHMLYSTAAISVSANTDYTYSLYAKAGTSRYVNLNVFGNSANHYISAVFDIGDTSLTARTEQSVGTSSGTIAGTKQEYLGNGWFRLSLTGKTSQTTVYLEACIASSKTGNTFNGAGEVTFNAAGTETISLFGAQLEAGSFPTSYIPTTTASVTRVADVVKLSGAALTTAGANTGTAIVQTSLWQNATAAARDLLSSATTRRLLYSNSSNTVVSSTDGTTGINATIGGSGTFTGGAVRSAIGWSAAGRSIVANNGTLVSDAVNLSTGATVTLGGYGTTTTFDGWVGSIALYNQRLSDTTLKSKSIVGSTY